MHKTTSKQLFLGIIICTIAAFFYCYEYLLRIIPGAIQPELRQAFGNITATAFGNLTAYYYYAYTPMQLPVGMLMDRFGPRRLLFLACLLCAVGSLLFTYTESLGIAAAGRFIIGFGSAFAFVGVLSLAHAWLPRQYFSLTAGIVTTLGMAGAILGEVGVTMMVKNLGWKAVMFGTAWIGVLLTLVIFFVVKDAPHKRPASTMSSGDFFRDVIKVITSLQVWLVGMVGSLLYLSLSVFAEVWGQTYLRVVHHMEAIDAAKAVSMVFLGWAIGAPLAGFVSDWTRRRILLLVVGALGGAFCIAMVLYVPGLSAFSIQALLLLYGIFCSTEIIIFIMGKENCAANLAGTAFAVVNMIVMLGGAILQPLVGVLLDAVWTGELFNGARVYSEADYQIVLSILPLGLMLVAILAFFLKEKVSSHN